MKRFYPNHMLTGALFGASIIAGFMLAARWLDR